MTYNQRALKTVLLLGMTVKTMTDGMYNLFHAIKLATRDHDELFKAIRKKK